MNLYMVEIRVRDWTAAMRWYRDVLGLELEMEDAPNRFALFKAGAGRVALKWGVPVETAHDAINLSFEVGDVAAERARLIELGTSVGEVFESPYQEGYREARLRDPEGTHLRLFSWHRG